MALEMPPDARPRAADAVMEDALTPDVQSMGAHLTSAPHTTRDQRAAQERLDALIEAQEQHTERIAGLEEAARAAIAAITDDASNRVTTSIEQSEQRIVDALSLADQQQREMTRWREGVEEQLRTQLRDLSEWDETLTEMKHEVGGLREMAEASVSLASGDLDERWETLRRELSDILATAESDERARWEAFMASAGDTIASQSGIDPAELETVRTDVVALRDAATTTITQLQQTQREQLAALRSEVHTLIESERSRIGSGVDAKLDEARQLFQTQTQSLHDWQQQVGKDVAQLRQSAQTAEAGVRAAQTALQTESQTALDTIRMEIESGVALARAAAQGEIASIRSDCERMVRRAQQQSQTFQSLALIIAVVAFLIGVGAFAVTFLHLSF